MNRLLCLAFIAFFAAGSTAIAFSEQLPALGGKLKKKWTKQDPDGGNVWVVHSAQIYPCVHLAFDGIQCGKTRERMQPSRVRP